MDPALELVALGVRPLSDAVHDFGSLYTLNWAQLETLAIAQDLNDGVSAAA